MGFLNHSTNNIIIDAVLTEKGRELLSNGGSSFKITRFSLGDDEVDYSILEQYGLIIGKEKIEKNTPIFEAITDENLALKHELRTLTSNNTNKIYAFPYLKLEDNISTPVVLTSNSASTSRKTSTVFVKTFVNQDDTFTLNDELIDKSFTVKVFNKLLKVNNSDPDYTRGDTAFYTISTDQFRTDADFTGQVYTKLNLTAIGVVTSSTYQYYATSSDSTLIRTQVEIVGNNTGATLVVPVTITSNQL